MHDYSVLFSDLLPLRGKQEEHKVRPNDGTF
jgi:hypothetical protein